MNERQYGNTYRNLRAVTCLDHKTVKAIEENDVNLKNVDPAKLLRLYNFLVGQDNALTPEAFFQFYGDSLNQDLIKLYSEIFQVNNTETTQHAIEALLDTPEKLKIFSVISCLNKLTIEQVRVLGGETLISAAYDLYNQGALKLEDETFFPNWDSEWVSLSKSTVQKHYSNMSQELDINSREKYGTPHYLFGSSYGWNLTAIQKSMEIITRCQREHMELERDERSRGNIPYYVFLASGQYVNDMNNFYGPDQGVIQ